MSENQNPLQTQPIGKIVMAGIGIAITSILLFGLIWFGLGQADIAQLPRLAAAVCVPPGIMTLITIGLYFQRGKING